MKIAVMGAGAVGCYYGGMLARAGHEVTLVGREQHVHAVRREGLFMDTLAFQEHIPVKACTDANGIRDARLVLCCVKSTDTADAAKQMAPYLAPDAWILSLQNGVDNAERLQALLKRDVFPVVVYVAAAMAGPGHVKHHGRGELVIGPSAASEEIVRLFAEAGVAMEISDNVAGALWAKLILNCAYNALSAITQMPYGRLAQGVGVEALMHDVMDECLAVAQRDGVSVPGNTWEAVLGIAHTMPTQISSTAIDLARGKASEIDHLNGFVLARGEALGIPTPVNRVLHSLVRLLETRAKSVAEKS
ncbi:MAG: ketopantoate reductase family protein [Sulfuritalea sp.]|nr:ketopantoate reductase family protein [Sulfuritalea sp.]